MLFSGILYIFLVLGICGFLSIVIMGDEKNEAGDGPEEDVEPASPDVTFAPVIELPELVSIKTMEEEEEEVFKIRSKLYRMDNEADPPEWKERGLGDIKILLHPKRKSYRVVMRREQTLKICANHAITRDMTLRPMVGSEKAFVWFTPADAADEEPVHQTLAARFGSKENADAFKAAFETAASKSHPANESDDEEGEEKENASKKENDEGEKKESDAGANEKIGKPVDNVIDNVSADLDKLAVKEES